ncbi:MAG: S8 family peptidase [Candidatus Woesearchaeota archaeon]
MIRDKKNVELKCKLISINYVFVLVVLALFLCSFSEENYVLAVSDKSSHNPLDNNLGISIEDKIRLHGSANVIIILEEEAIDNINDNNNRKNKNIPQNSNNLLLDSVRDVSGIKNSVRLNIINGYSGELDAKGLTNLDNLKAQGVNFRIYEDKILRIHDDLIINNSYINNSYDSDSVGEYISIDVSVNLSENISENLSVNISMDDTTERDSYDANSTIDIIDYDNYTANNTIAKENIEESIEENDLLYTSLGISTAAIGANYSWDVLNITGRNITVAVIDTGVDYTHPALGGCFGNGTNNSCKVFDGYDFYNNDSDPIDDHNHGTGVAGIISANGIVKGVAPDSIIYALKVCNSAGNCPTSDIIRALEWSVNDSHFAQIISISLGSYASDTDTGNSGKDPLSIAIDSVVSQGVVVVISAGNDGQGVSTINNPASSENVITVGAIDDHDTVIVTDDDVASFSSRGPSAFGRLDPDIVAPGVYVQSTTRYQSLAYMSGTSFSAPFVSGAAALLLEYDSDLTPENVRAILIQSTQNISGKLFEKGSGELDVMSALSNNLYAIINYTNPYNQNVLNDRWEFVIIPNEISYANITIINDNDYNITLDYFIESITNMENDETLDVNYAAIPENIIILSNSEYTFQINFTLDNFNSTYATTYGGIIVFNGTGYNGSDNVTKNLRIPIVVTVPILNYAYLTRTMYSAPDNAPYYSNEDVYYYCYYSLNPRNVNFFMNWTDSDYWINLYLYNSSGDIDTKSKTRYVNNQHVSTTNSDIFKWVRIDGYLFDSQFDFNLNISEMDNSLPEFNAIIPVNGYIDNNDSNNFTLIFYRPNDIIFNVSYYDSDNDSVIVYLNGSEYTSYILSDDCTGEISNCSSSSENLSNSSGYLIGHAIYSKNYNSSINNTSIIVAIKDSYGGTTFRTINIIMSNSLVIDSYTPITKNNYILPNDSILFNVEINSSIFDLGSFDAPYYSWNIIGIINETYNETLTLNDTSGNFISEYSFNSSFFNASEYVVSVLIFIPNSSSYEINRNISWNVSIDTVAPTIVISSPVNDSVLVYNNSIIDINYSVTDALSGVDSCWYDINSSINISGATSENYSSNNTLTSCHNTTIYLASGQHLLMLYSKDVLENIKNYNISFNISDVISPIILDASPFGDISYTTSINLSVSTNENSVCRYSSTDVGFIYMTEEFISNGTEHTIAYDVDTLEYHIYIRCRDLSNNTNDNSYEINFNIEEESSGNNNGGGGGGSSGVGLGGYSESGVVVDNVNGVYETLDYLEEDTTIDVSSSQVPVSKLIFSANENISNLIINITKINDSEILYLDGVSYSYFNVSISYLLIENNLSQRIFDSSISVKLLLYVENEWFEKYGIDIDDVQLFRYNDNNNRNNNTNNIWINQSLILLNIQDNLSNIFNVSNISNNISGASINRTYYSALSVNSGTYVIAQQKNISQSQKINNSIDAPDLNNITKSDTPRIHYASEGLNYTNNSLSNTSKIRDNLISGVLFWISLAVASLFVILLIVLSFVKYKALINYKNDLLIETKTDIIKNDTVKISVKNDTSHNINDNNNSDTGKNILSNDATNNSTIVNSNNLRKHIKKISKVSINKKIKKK